MALTKAEYARFLAKIGRVVSSAQSDLAEGMWNPDFCSSDAGDIAASQVIEISDRVKHIINRLKK